MSSFSAANGTNHSQGTQITFSSFLDLNFSIEKKKLSNNNNKFCDAGIEGEHNVLQKHVSFFDQNHDGIVYPWETFKGLL